jgi:CheY-like chemotaxis protein
MRKLPPLEARWWVLVVEDDGARRALLVDLLGELGYASLPVGCGERALKLLDLVVPHLILLDLRMPRMDGAAFRREQLRCRLAADVPVVAMTAAAEGGLPSDWPDPPPSAVLAKPFDLDDLDRVLRAATATGG